MLNQVKQENPQEQKTSTLRLVSKKEDEKEPYTANIPIKENKLSLVLPEGYIDWPENKPYPEPVRIKIDDEKNLWINFGVSKKHGFYVSIKVSEAPKQ